MSHARSSAAADSARSASELLSVWRRDLKSKMQEMHLTQTADQGDAPPDDDLELFHSGR